MDINKQSFTKEVLESDQLVLVDFWAPWCGPCQMMGPILDQLGKDMAGEIKVVKVDIDQNQDLAAKYKVMSIPALFLFHEGKVVKQWLGVQNIDRLEEEVKQVLS